MPCQGPWGGGYGQGSGDVGYKKAQLHAERQLCEARWLVLRLTETCPAELPQQVRDLIATHRVKQLAHRRGDKQHVLERIRATLDRLRREAAEITKLGGRIGERHAAHVARLRAERTRITAITDTQLLADYWGTETRLTSDVVDHDHDAD